MLKEFRLDFKKIDPYKSIGGLAGGLGGYFVARKKGYDSFHTILLVLFGSSLGMIASDIADGVRLKDENRVRDLTESKSGIFTNFITKNFIFIIAGAYLAYLFTKKDVKNNKQILILSLFVVIFAFYAKETIKKTEMEELDEDSFSIFSSKVDAEFALFGVMIGLLVAYGKGADNLETFIYPLVGLGGGMLAGNSIKARAESSSFQDIYEEGGKGLSTKRRKSKTLLTSIGKSIINSKSKDKRPNLRKRLSSKIDKFVYGLDERDLVVLEKVYDNLKSKISGDKPLSYTKAVSILKKDSIDEKDIDTFYQVTNNLSKAITKNGINSDGIGKEAQYKVRKRVEEYEITSDDMLTPTGVSYQKGETITGKERWVWLNSKIEGKNIRKQIRLIEVARDKYIFHIGVDKL